MTAAEELQHAPADEFWERFNAVMGGPDGLMTYRYLGTRADVGGAGPSTGGMRIRRDMRNSAGGLLAAPLSIALADAGGVVGDAAGVPAPVSGTVHILDAGQGVNAVTVRGFGLHSGRTLGFSHAEVLDADDPSRVIAVTSGMSVNLGSAPPGYVYVDPGPGVPDSPQLPPLHEAFGARRHPGGGWQLPELTQKLGSTSGSLHHGPIQIVLEAAALELAIQTIGTDQLQIQEWSVMFLQRGTTGPFVTDGEVLTGRLGRVACRMSLRDEGNENRLISSALAVFYPAE
jgi:acyl-coenzyme A thioesterase PaaI-like protein